ncbi:hypothetical protein [Flavisphingomonas formosensis]|uniref:hypothetical protein n=1 Tax=Flavisphingomonas formosensis TaxID=861534 RepID=UPI0012F79234|nr:hypothetical protein [Sphingomonas formosensis]
MAQFSQFGSFRPRLAVGALALLAIGGGLGAAVTHAVQPVAVMAPPNPVRIATLAAASRPWFGDPVVTVRGRVAESYGNSVIVSDGSGRVLVDASPHAVADGALPVNQTVSVQGRYADGIIHAQYLVSPDGRIAAVGPHGGRHGAGGPHRGWDDGHGDVPPPPPGAAPADMPPPAPAQP